MLGYEVPIHHVHVDQIGAGGFDTRDFVSKPGKICERIDGAMRTLTG